MYQSTCGGDGSSTACYVDNVINNGSNYADAYFSINYVKVFSLTDGVLVPSASGGSTVLVTESATSATSEPSATSPSGAQSGNSAVVMDAKAYVAVVGAAVLSACSWVLL